MSNEEIKAVHYDGGNYYNDLRINISESHKRLVIRDQKTEIKKTSRLRSFVKLLFTRFISKHGLSEFFIITGMNRKWFDEFHEYWSNILNGRPIYFIVDFFILLNGYRKHQQFTSKLSWDSPAVHIKNWQDPSQIYLTMNYASTLAKNPIIGEELWKYVTKEMNILEYGCSLAPYYYCYRRFYSYLGCNWTLADIPNFPFHYAKYLYRNDNHVKLATINEEDFSNPLGEVKSFDVIIITTVLEHLDDPIFVVNYLLERLKPGGLFVFDYIKSKGDGLDHPKSVEMRRTCLEIIQKKTHIISGNISDIEESIGLCIAEKLH